MELLVFTGNLEYENLKMDYVLTSLVIVT